MEAETPPVLHVKEAPNLLDVKIENNPKRLSNGHCDEEDANSTIHAFNSSNVTVIERLSNGHEKQKLNLILDSNAPKATTGDGSDSGVEVCTNEVQRAFSSNSNYGVEDCTPAQSCDSSLISFCSTYEDAYDLLARKNSTLLDDLKASRCDGTGSESSSVTGSSSSRTGNRITNGNAKKKVAVNEPTKFGRNSLLTPRSSTKTSQDKVKPTTRPSTFKSFTKPKPQDPKKDSGNKTPRSSRTPSTTRTKTPITPNDDGRWPSLNNRNCVMTRSFRGTTLTSEGLVKSRSNQLEQKNNTLDKYATLPRRRKEKSADSIKDLQKKPLSRDASANRVSSLRRQVSRETTPSRSLPPYPKKKPISKTKIYHEVSSQTCLTIEDVEKVLAGILIRPLHPNDTETAEKQIQVDRTHENLELLETQMKALLEKNNKLIAEAKGQKEKLAEVEQKYADEQIEKQALKEELKRNMQRVQTILNNTDDSAHQDSSDDSFLVLESRFQAAGQVIIKQENEISELHSFCRSLQRDLEKSFTTEKILLQQQRDLETESAELQEFMQAEKTALSETLHESELKLKAYEQNLAQRDNEIERQQDECKHLVRISEQRRQENLALQARLGLLESRSRELLLHQGAAISGSAVALTGLIARIDGFVEQLITSYNISDKDLEDVIFHNEAYSNSSVEGSPERSRASPLPKKGSSFVTAIISAIRNAAAQAPFSNVSKITNDDLSDSTDMLDSETEPCLMMENVLEDAPMPDGHSHNLISSGHSLYKSGMLARSESLQNLSQAILNRQLSEQARLDGSLYDSMHGSCTENLLSLSEICPNVALVDQVIEADNLLTKLLKVLRIIQLENDNCINDLQDERTELSDKLHKQRETNEKAAQQLKDWESLGARLKGELQDVKTQLNIKSKEVEDVKVDLLTHRQQIERLNQDVCDLSTTCSKAELQLKLHEEEATKILKDWQESGQLPTEDVLSKLVADRNEMPILKEKLNEKEKQLNELLLEYEASRQVMTENWNQVVSEAKKQYEAIDTALETLHSIQSVVQQCPPLAKLQRDLEETNFHCVSSMPFASPDHNANAALLQAAAAAAAAANLHLAAPQATAINSTA